MKGGRSFIVFLIIMIFTSQTVFILPIINAQSANYSIQTEQKIIPVKKKQLMTNDVSGIENIKTNVIRNGGFEEEDLNGGPNGFYHYGSGFTIANASYQDDVHSGSYSYYMSTKGTEQYSNNGYFDRSLTSIPERAYLDEKITLDMFFNTKANPDFALGANTFMYLRIYTGTINYYLQYYFSRVSALPLNGTSTAYFDVRDTIGSWHNLHRNLTLDFEQALGIPVTSDMYVRSIYFRVNSLQGSTGDLILLVDDTSITNSTAFEYIQANGDFEDGDGNNWNNYRNGPGSNYLTQSDYTEEEKSLNLTSNAYYENSNGYTYTEKSLSVYWNYYPKSFYPTEHDDFLIDFDWKYSDTENSGYLQYSSCYIVLTNSTFETYLNFLLGEDQDIMTFSNYTYPAYQYLWYAAEGFGSRDTWQHFSLDLFDFIEIENLYNLVPTYIGFRTEAGFEANSTVQLLIDDLKITTYPSGDPSFEQDLFWLPNDPISSWGCYPNHFYANLTEEAHSGNYAVNLSSYSSPGEVYCYRDMYLPVENNLFTNFWWKLDEITTGSFADSYIRLELDSSHYITYILGSNSDTSFTNSSNFVYYYVEEYNQTGVWNNLFRDISNDTYTAFGEDEWNITQIRLCSYATASTVVTTLFDDMYFVRDVTGPELTNLEINPDNPQYGEVVTITVDAVDNIAIDTVELTYKIGDNTWQAIPMTINGLKYEAVIPAADWNIVVQYYIESFDVYGLMNSLGSLLDPFTYTVDDNTFPILDIEAPETTESLIGIVQFNISGEDPGSGIDTFEIAIDDQIKHSNNTILSEYLWDTTVYENGNHTISFLLIDGKGNYVEQIIEYNVDNPIPWYIQTWNFIKQYWPYLTAGVGGLIVAILVIVIVVRVRKRRVA